MWRSLFRNMKNSALKVSSFSPSLQFLSPAKMFDFCYGVPLSDMEILAGQVQVLKGAWRPCPVTQWSNHYQAPPPTNCWKNSSGSGWSEEPEPGICPSLGLPPQPKADRQPPEMAASTSGTTQYLNWWRRGLESLNLSSNMLCPTSLRWGDTCRACPETAQCTPDHNLPGIIPSAQIEWRGWGCQC